MYYNYNFFHDVSNFSLKTTCAEVSENWLKSLCVVIMYEQVAQSMKTSYNHQFNNEHMARDNKGLYSIMKTEQG